MWWFHQTKRPTWLVADTVLSNAGMPADTKAGWHKYLNYLDVLAEESPAERRRKFAAMGEGWAVGTQSFRPPRSPNAEGRPHPGSAARLGDTDGDYEKFRCDVRRERLAAIAAAAKVPFDRLGTASRRRAKYSWRR
ncbi:MAG: hypothetical protein ACREF9_13260 [Opitutaceae bacterium]